MKAKQHSLNKPRPRLIALQIKSSHSLINISGVFHTNAVVDVGNDDDASKFVAALASLMNTITGGLDNNDRPIKSRFLEFVLRMPDITNLTRDRGSTIAWNFAGLHASDFSFTDEWPAQCIARKWHFCFLVLWKACGIDIQYLAISKSSFIPSLWYNQKIFGSMSFYWIFER